MKLTSARLVAVLCVLTLAHLPQAYAGGYFGISAGNSKDKELDESDTGFKVSVGGLVSDNAAVEVAYVDLGDINVGFFDVSQSGFAFSISPLLKLNQQSSLYAKIGLFAWTFEVSDGFSSGKDTGTDVFFGFGFEYRFGEQTALIAEYEKFDVSDGDVDLASVGVRIGF